MSTTIYVLRLEGGHYYIGKSDNIAARYQQHLNGKGSAWTKKYPPVSLVTTIEGASPFDEDKITKEYMVKYGIDNVRGGSYVQIELSPFHMNALNMEIRGATDLCTQCGRAGHFVRNCYAKTDASGKNIKNKNDSDSESGSENESGSESESESESDDEYNSGVCYRCGRAGHYASDCYARTYVGRK